MKRPVNISFLTEEENQCLEYLLLAQDLFDEICKKSPQSAADTYNFGHYIEAARSAILVRGARRLDPENLLVQHSNISSITPTMKEHLLSLQSTYDKDKGPFQESEG